ncbi:MAG: HAD family hydrolase [Candidatus Thermoplasmatota archaeon]
MAGPDFANAKAILFDMDDTLINWRAAEAGAVAALSTSHFVPAGATHDTVVSTYATILEETWEMWRRERRWIYVTERLRTLTERLGLSGLDADALGAQFHVEAASRLALLDGADEVLATARQGRRTALLTNGRPEIQRPKVDRFRFDTKVDFVGITGELGAWKPDLRAFRIVLDRLGVAPEEAIMVGDAIDFDIVPAKRLGMGTVWVNPTGSSHPDADLVVASPAGMLSHFAALHAQPS